MLYNSIGVDDEVLYYIIIYYCNLYDHDSTVNFNKL